MLEGCLRNRGGASGSAICAPIGAEWWGSGAELCGRGIYHEGLSAGCAGKPFWIGGKRGLNGASGEAERVRGPQIAQISRLQASRGGVGRG